MVETWIAARADFFVGTVESRSPKPSSIIFFYGLFGRCFYILIYRCNLWRCRFTMSIQLERSFLGKPHRSSQEEFCKVYSEKPCLAPSCRS